MFNYIQDRWGVDLKNKYAFFISKKNNVYLASRDVDLIDFKQLKVNNIGIYAWEWKHDECRLSIDGSQLIGKEAQRNIVELNKGLFTLWMAGYDLELTHESVGFVIIKHENDIVGCGRAVDGKILNFVPKARRIRSE